MKFFAPILLSLVVLLSFTSTIKADSQVNCQLCKFVVNHAEELLLQNNTIHVIEQKLELGCKVLPKEWAGACSILVEEYTPMIIQMLVKKAPAESICATLGMCPRKISMRLDMEAPIGSTQCTLCTFVVNKVESYILTNATEQQVIHYLHKDCNLLREKHWVSACKAVVSNYTPKIIDYLVRQVSPKTICGYIGLCVAQPETPVFDFVPGVLDMMEEEPMILPGQIDKNKLKCTACTQIGGMVKKFLEQQQTIQQISAFLEKQCDLLEPKSSKTMCKLIVANYLPSIVRQLENLTPQQVCGLLHLC
eukprot:gene5212-6490_t